ncbi:EF-P lysine aminoacylase GenX [Gracilinema caldarium]|uniref:Lysine--tRNA ligase n=1 Tax=Gracilinema caldarium (strain ATCC 51460 / DSM 7334 / H1) TaxID=744872 RepID=F8F2L2_GRAC1|nr:amino acid--tRNA ligase-related protein [Gracilinema caldarium]AEJ19127.1 Lysine--tRNA ligase [Gracilinema caldarium DSM 7334]
MDIELLETRSRTFRNIRSFFDSKAYLEVDTPTLASHLIPETCLEVFKTEYVLPPDSQGRHRRKEYYLVPSPELWMKQLIAQHRRSMYQICKCFRNGESTGELHSPEFTMLEYYTMDADYRDSIAITEELFKAVLPQDVSIELRPPFLQIPMEEAFLQWAGFSLYDTAAQGRDAMAEKAQQLGLPVPDFLDLGDLYNLIFVHAVEPQLPRDHPVVLMDYPAFVPCLAKNCKGKLAKERWELYVRGIELANCYTEETDPDEVRRYFAAEGAKKQQKALIPHAIDTNYWHIFQNRRNALGEAQSFPACSGVAMGLDRLIMAIVGRSTIDSVLPFPMTGNQ